MVCSLARFDRMFWQCWRMLLTLTCCRETQNVMCVLKLLRMHRLLWNHTKKYRWKTTGNSKFSLVRLLFFNGSTREDLSSVTRIAWHGIFMDIFRYLCSWGKDCTFSLWFFLFCYYNEISKTVRVFMPLFRAK